jgi:hypothetical protein
MRLVTLVVLAKVNDECWDCVGGRGGGGLLVNWG